MKQRRESKTKQQQERNWKSQPQQHSTEEHTSHQPLLGSKRTFKHGGLKTRHLSVWQELLNS